MRIERIDELALDEATAAEIGALLAAVFGGGLPGRSLLSRHHLRLVRRDAGRVVGHLALGLRVIRLGDRLVDVVTVAEVVTAPGRRGEGVASALLAEAVAVARGTPGEFVLLFGTARIYAAAGFRGHTNMMRRVDMAGRWTRAVVEEPARDLMVLPLRAAVWSDEAPIDLLGPKF